MKDTKGPMTQATMFLKTEEVAFTNYLYVYEERCGSIVSVRKLIVSICHDHQSADRWGR